MSEHPQCRYQITGFADEEEEEAVGLAARAKWLMEDEVTDKVDVGYSRGPIWQPYTVVDRNLFTGQNPASSGPWPGSTSCQPWPSWPCALPRQLKVSWWSRPPMAATTTNTPARRL
jgi:hypothetical protein